MNRASKQHNPEQHIIHMIRKADDTVGNPNRAQISQFELFELILLLHLDKQLPVE